MSEFKKNQSRPANNDEQATMQNTSERQQNEETTAQNDGFRYDYDDSSDL
ncbi:hypothetical protein [Alkalihalobacterium chitinilyticum]|uniref:DUF4025 domain-containing protein n=1 Tax=Alkalihalobacterium chitinilyticum TaxID=2980103 RepID=A0ABT5VGX6_9BACI|nr:hypothetical protein [Alkalihalobacterium chitinilyticum]MDE5413459.1 hypothetical protein [Alkalihalobacterium chitinilyticum]